MNPLLQLLAALQGPAMAQDRAVELDFSQPAQQQQTQVPTQAYLDFQQRIAQNQMEQLPQQLNQQPQNNMFEILNIRNVRNNNPGNIKDFGIPWAGKSTEIDPGGKVASGSFVKFQTPEYGVRALVKDLTTKRSKGIDTLEKILNIYAPPGRENDTNAYIKNVSKTTGLNPTQRIKDENMFDVVKAIIAVEGGPKSLQYYTDDVIKGGFNLLKDKK